MMTGTSLDGADLVLATFDDHPTVIAAEHHPYPDALHDQAAALADGERIDFVAIARFKVDLSEWFADLALRMIQQHGAVDGIAVQGQSLAHLPGLHAFQALQPERIAARCQTPVIAEFRNTDMALGGQGAPLSAAFHQRLFDLDGIARAVVGISGMAHLTYLGPKGELSGDEIGPGNLLMDAWAERHLNLRWDMDGAWARQGRVSTDLLRVLRAEPFFDQPSPKAAGPGLFTISWLDQTLKTLATKPSPVDVMATLLELTAWSISKHLAACPVAPTDVVLCGGGANNRALVERIGQLCSLPTRLSDELGIPVGQVGATAFAWFGHCRLARQRLDLGTITGASSAGLYGTLFEI
ncbi:anhydro-N-acetylmuramic acid kinase [Litorivicinus lipolyticus]|uniref:anhydro-N-acetylmuramic acid kinase n=1 Tax=Litorivicinus lipolyticus TaxID=418701 RepID=UPI002342E9B1|nr:anhydro-N-acetylmuramic acid kinase [Litorivicinus lipolyticus]